MSIFFTVIIILLFFLCSSCILVLKRKCISLSCTDELTGLWNLKYFRRQVSRILKSNKKDTFAIVDIDFRNFRYINMIYGVDEGDRLLGEFGRELSRFVSPYGGCVARGYADHFFLFRKLVHDETPESFTAAITRDTDVYNGKTFAGTGLKGGIVFTGPEYGYDTVSNLFNKAAYAKRYRENSAAVSCTVFGRKMAEQMFFEQKIECSIGSALKNRELYVVYQPQINLLTGKITGAEALVRWHRRDFEDINPDAFIPVLEKSGDICDMDFYVYETVFKFLRQRLDTGQQLVPVSVNMSRRHLDKKDFAGLFFSLLQKYSIPPHYICVEILERSSGYDRHLLKNVTCELRGKGVSVAIDDFGSGESSFDMLGSVPVNILKIDRRFLKDLEPAGSSAVILEKIVELAKNLGKKTVCEGAETQLQIDFLKQIACEEVQGFYYSRPLSEKDFIVYMQQHL